jgi:sporulation protein YunB
MKFRYGRNPWRRSGRRFVLALFAGFMALLVLFVIVEKRIEPTLLVVATQKVDQMAKGAINEAVTKRISQQGVDFFEIVALEKDAEGSIKAVNFNFKEYSRIIGETTSRIQNRLKEFEEENVTVSIPLALATKNAFLEHYGPHIPVTFVPIGAVKTRLETSLQEAGINMVLATVYILVEVDLQIVIPFATEHKRVTTQIPITEALIVGKVPDYLYNNPQGKPDVPLPRR